MTEAVPGSNRTVIEIIQELRAILRPEDFKSRRKAYLRGGYLLDHWLRRFQNFTASNSTQNPKKAVFYSSVSE